MRATYLRELYGGLFATVLPDGQEVVWRPLTVGEFIEYDKLIRIGQYPLAYLENEIFKKCVQQKFLVETLNDLPAGIVSTVAATILQYSGPNNQEDLTYLLNLNRVYSEQIMHQMVIFICWGFPAYKPEDIYAMNYETLMLRLAQAENKLARLGLISEPFTFTGPEAQEEAPVQQKPKRPTEDLLNKYYEQEGIVDPKTGKPPTTTKRAERPAPKATHTKKSTQTVVTTADVQEHQMAYVGHEMQDKDIIEHNMVSDTVDLYQGYVEQMQKDGKIKFKSDEERVAEYKARMSKIATRVAKVDAARQEQKAKLQEAVAQEQAKPKRKRHPGRRR